MNGFPDDVSFCCSNEDMALKIPSGTLSSDGKLEASILSLPVSQVLTSSHHGVQYQNMYALKASTVLFDKC
jgi:hypothetical protein